MSKLAHSAPLANLSTASSISSHEVQTHINEPIIPRLGARRRRIGLQAILMLSRLELMISKEASLGTGSKMKTALSADIEKTSESLEVLIAQIKDDGRSENLLRTFIQGSHLDPTFPKTAKSVGLTLSSSNKDIQGHFTHMSFLNQLISMSLQLQHDLKLANHKYIAYQIALLYQCINQVGGPFAKYKLRVEQQFDAIKAITFTSESPVLPIEMQNWLETLVHDIVCEALYTGHPFAQQTQFFYNFMAKVGEAEN